jgi:hypothetical protein
MCLIIQYFFQIGEMFPLQEFLLWCQEPQRHDRTAPKNIPKKVTIQVCPCVCTYPPFCIHILRSVQMNLAREERTFQTTGMNPNPALGRARLLQCEDTFQPDRQAVGQAGCCITVPVVCIDYPVRTRVRVYISNRHFNHSPQCQQIYTEQKYK